jgi:pyruvate kinase
LSTPQFAPRGRRVRILATLGPASASPEMIEKLFRAGADAFRVNMSHGTQAERALLIGNIRALEKQLGRASTILVDLQGPKLRVGTFAQGSITLKKGQNFQFDLDPTPGDAKRVCLPHREVFDALKPDSRLLLDDGKLVLRVTKMTPLVVTTKVEVGGPLSNHKGLNVPDLAFALDQGVDWIALSFVQRPDDLAEARRLIGGKASLLAKIEKPAALDQLEGILEMADAVMVARGDLGVELPPEAVPPAQKRIVEMARKMGKPVVVATQMLESMIKAPTPTRAEVSDVATAIYDGADAIMLSAESAAGDWPEEAVAMMNRIAISVESDKGYAARLHFTETKADPTTADALSEAAFDIAKTVSAAAIICFTTSGSTARRISRERPSAPLLVLTPKLSTARQMGLQWGAHAVHTKDVSSFEEMIAKAKRMVLRQGLAKAGDRVVMMAGVPFGTPGSTNVLHVVRLTGEELKGYR